MEATNAFESDTFKFLVGSGDGQRTFTVHESIFSSRSKNVAAALVPNRWQEGDDRVIKFPTDDPKAFEAYIQFAYRPDLIHQTVRKVSPSGFRDLFTLLCRLYVLSDVLMDDDMNMDAFVNIKYLCHVKIEQKGKLKRVPPPVEAIRVIFENTSGQDGIREVIEECFVDDDIDDEFMSELFDSEHIDDFPTKICYELLVRMMSYYLDTCRSRAVELSNNAEKFERMVLKKDREIQRLKEQMSSLKANMKKLAQ